MDLQEEITTETTIEDNRIIVKKYDKEGKLVNQIPAGYVPMDERI